MGKKPATLYGNTFLAVSPKTKESGPFSDSSSRLGQIQNEGKLAGTASRGQK
jgi:hypothetical protein